MTEREFRRQLEAIGLAAGHEIDRYEQQLTRVRKALRDQRKRAAGWRARQRTATGSSRRDECRWRAECLESVIKSVEKAMRK